MRRFKKRYKIIASIFIVVGIIFLSKLFYIQVMNDDYKFSANNNALRYEVQQAVRGLIYDRDSNLIVANVPAYDLMIIPRELKNKKIDTLKLCTLLEIDKNKFIHLYNKAKKYSAYKESVFIKHISKENASKIGENLYEFPGFYLRKITMREYPTNSATHLIGYLGEVNSSKTKKDPFYTKGDLNGVSGVEAAYEDYLRGTKGMAIKLVDVHNRDQGKFQNGKFDTLPIAGSTLTTTINIELQKYGEKLMQNKIGAIVAIEPSSGEILALVSAPTYNPNLLIGRKRSKNYKNLTQDPNKPLFNFESREERLKKLEKAKVISGSQIILNPKILGFKTVAFIGIYLDKAIRNEEVVKQLKIIPEVVECHYTTGNWSVFAKIVCRDNEHLMELLNKKIQSVNGVSRTETFISLQEQLNRQIAF